MKNLQKGQPMTQSGTELDTEHIKAKKSRACWIRHSSWNFVTTVSKWKSISENLEIPLTVLENTTESKMEARFLEETA
jgi:hypothetical protein